MNENDRHSMSHIEGKPSYFDPKERERSDREFRERQERITAGIKRLGELADELRARGR